MTINISKFWYVIDLISIPGYIVNNLINYKYIEIKKQSYTFLQSGYLEHNRNMRL